MTEQHNGAGEKAHNNNGAKQQKPTSAYKKLRRKFAKTALRAPLVWYRHRNLLPTDVFLGSYPKSGITWIRFVLFEMLSGKAAGFRSVNQLMAGVGLHSDAVPLLPEGGRLLSTHEHYRKVYGRAIYVVRDARDVLLSEYAFMKALEYVDGDLDQFISSFLFSNVSVYGPWQRHVASWLDSPIAGTENLMLVRFEDLRQDPVGGFTRIAEFLKVDLTQEKIRLAVENNSIQNMREKENREPVRVSIKGRFVRNGAVRGWLSKLSPAQVRLIEEHAGNALLRLGYPLSSQLDADQAQAPLTINEPADTGVRV